MPPLPEISEQDRTWYILKGYNITIDHWGNRVWYLNGVCHREDGPAVEYADGSKEWSLNGKSHRTDGPAYERSDGRSDGHRVWYLNDEHMTEEEHRKAVQEINDAI